jgi:diguanylate cyclase (GGDEF)-like protein
MILGCFILLSFGLNKSFGFKYFSWLLFLATLILGIVYVITFDRGSLSLAWLLTALPVVIGLYRYPNNLYLALGLFLIGALVFFSTESTGQSAHFLNISALQFFLIATGVCGISLTASKALIDHQDKINQLSSVNDALAFQDSLSGLYNRRYMESLLSSRFLNLQQNESFSIVIADLDNFRSINELYGHNAGDNVISQVSKLLESTLEDTYIIARWDGNAFIVLLPNHEEEASRLIAELLRKKIKRLKLKNQGYTLKLSLSLSTASSVKCSDLNDLLSHAENSLYQAKQMGGNIVIQS